MENPNRTICIKEIESKTKNFSKQEVPDEFSGKATKNFKKVKAEGVFLNSFYVVSITLLPKQMETLLRKENYKPVSLINADAKVFQKILTY